MTDHLLLRIALPTLAYLMGAIPCGLLLARRFTRVDLRQEGSGNIGATNVARVGGPALGLATLAADMLKALAPVWAASVWGPSPLDPVIAAVAAVLGHTFPIYTRFRGGAKGLPRPPGGSSGSRRRPCCARQRPSWSPARSPAAPRSGRSRPP